MLVLAFLVVFGLVEVVFGLVTVWVTGVVAGVVPAAKLGDVAPARARKPVAIPSAMPSDVLVTTECYLTFFMFLLKQFGINQAPAECLTIYMDAHRIYTILRLY